MGNCTTSNTVDLRCNHNKPFMAVCITPGCSRDEYDRRLCQECVIDHPCMDKVTIIDLIQQDKYQLQSLIYLLNNSGDKEKQQQEVGLTVDNFKKHFLESLNSYQLFYKETLNAYLLQQFPTEFANKFPEAARQIVECKQRNDFSLCGNEGRFVLVDTFGKTTEVKQIIQALDDCSRKMSSMLQEIEYKMKLLSEEWSKKVQMAPYDICKVLIQNEDGKSLFIMDVSNYNYNFSSFIPTTNIVTTDRASGTRCSEHSDQFQVICCDKLCTQNDVRLCVNCLMSHRCSPQLRIKLKSFQSDQSLIIEAATLYIKKKHDVDEAQQRIQQYFDILTNHVLKCCEELKRNSQLQLDSCMYKGIDENIRRKLPKYIEKLSKVFANRSMESLDQEGVQIIAYLVQNQHIRGELSNGGEAQRLIRGEFLNQLCQVLEGCSKQFMDTLSQVDKLPQKTIPLYETSMNLDMTNSKFKTTTIQQQQQQSKLSNVPNCSIVFKPDEKLEDQILDAMCRKTLNDFGDDSDDYISDIVVYDGLLVASSHSGVVCAYQIDNGFNKVCKIDLDGTCFSICAANYQNNKVVLANRGQLDSHAIECHTLEEDSKLLFTMEGHNGPILHIKLIDQFLLTCSGDSSIRLWDLNTHKQTKEVKIHTHQVRDVVEIKQNIIASCSFDETIKIYNLQTDKVVHYMECKAYVFSLVMIQAQQCLVAATGDGSIYLYNSVNFGLSATFQLGEVSITSMALLGDSYLVLSQQNREVHIVKLSNGKIIDRIAKNDEYDGTPEAVYAYRNQIIYGDGNVIKVYS